MSINNHGRAVGFSEAPGGDHRAVLWGSWPSAWVGPLITLPATDLQPSLDPAAVGSEASDINDGGTIVGHWRDAKDKKGYWREYAFKLENTKSSTLSLLGGDIVSGAWGVNESGDIVGYGLRARARRECALTGRTQSRARPLRAG